MFAYLFTQQRAEAESELGVCSYMSGFSVCDDDFFFKRRDLTVMYEYNFFFFWTSIID